MNRIVLLVLLLVFLVVVSEDIRGFLAPHVEVALNPVYEWSTRSRVENIARRIEADVEGGTPAPTTRDFAYYLQGRYSGADPTRDPWGTPYYLERGRTGLVVGSAGRDRTQGTEYDIRSRAVPLR